MSWNLTHLAGCLPGLGAFTGAHRGAGSGGSHEALTDDSLGLAPLWGQAGLWRPLLEAWRSGGCSWLPVPSGVALLG